MIKPVVNISKVIEPFDTVIVGLYGVLYDGRSFKTEAVEALKALKRSGRKIVLVSNASLRVQQVIRLLNDNKVPVMVFDAVVTAGEILHYKLKVKDETFKGLGLTYFNIGGSEGLGVFAGLDYLPVEELGRADFMYMGSCRSAADLVDSYLPGFEHAFGLRRQRHFQLHRRRNQSGTRCRSRTVCRFGRQNHHARQARCQNH